MKQRVISEPAVRSAVKKLVLRASFDLEPEVEALLQKAARSEKSRDGKIALQIILENIKIAAQKRLPICQDTGLSVFFVDLGREARLDFDLGASINRGLREATREGYLRCSVADPLTRRNTGDNTSAIVHVRPVAGNKIRMSLLIKGGGSENKSAVKMLTVSEGIAGIKRFVLETVLKAGGQSCPPIFVGLGLGGNLEMCAILAKRALARKAGSASKDRDVARLEKELLRDINKLGIGPGGLGGKMTCLAVQAEKAPGHIAGLAVAVNLQCWAHRGAEVVI